VLSGILAWGGGVRKKSRPKLGDSGKCEGIKGKEEEARKRQGGIEKGEVLQKFK